MSATAAAPANPWMRILDALEKKINRHSYETWLKPTRFSHSQNGILFVRVPTPDFLPVGEKYGDLIQEAIENLGLEYQDVEFVTPEQEKPPVAPPLPEQRKEPVSTRTEPPRQTAGAQSRFDWDGAS